MMQTLRRLFRLIFSDTIRLRRQGGKGLRVVLAPPEVPEFSTTQINEQERARAHSALMLRMQQELGEVLQHNPKLRRRDSHIVQLETALRTHGLLCLKAMPLPLLSKALADLEAAVTNWSPVGLATLRSKMAVAVAERRRAGEADDEKPVAAKPKPEPEGEEGSSPEVHEMSLPPDELRQHAEALMAAYAAQSSPAAAQHVPAGGAAEGLPVA